MEILAAVSSKGERKGRGRPRPTDDIRWVELTIYSTPDNDYIVETVRRSDVYHTSPTDCEAYQSYRVETVARDLVETDRPCYRCQPPGVDELAPYDIVLSENDRVEVRRTLYAEDVVEACREMVGTGEALAPIARRALRVAAERDPNIQAALSEQEGERVA